MIGSYSNLTKRRNIAGPHIEFDQIHIKSRYYCMLTCLFFPSFFLENLICLIFLISQFIPSFDKSTQFCVYIDLNLSFFLLQFLKLGIPDIDYASNAKNTTYVYFEFDDLNVQVCRSFKVKTFIKL